MVTLFNTKDFWQNLSKNADYRIILQMEIFQTYLPVLIDVGASREINSLRKFIRKTPCWAEVTYLRQPFLRDKRRILLLYIFALLEKQYGFALEVADFAIHNFEDTIFKDCRKAVLKKLNAEKWKIPLIIFKRQFNKFFANIND